MIINRQRITIVYHRKPTKQTLNDELQWLGDSLGLFNLRDKDKSCFRIFVELLKAARHNIALSSDELALNLKLTRGTVIHHINKLMESGIVVTDGKRYLLRVSSLTQLIDELEQDVMHTCAQLKKVAKHIDDSLGL